MRDAFFLLTVAGLALSVAGFAGLVSAFRSREEGWTRTELWRVRTIARLSFTLVFVCLIAFPLYAVSGDETFVVRVVSGLIVLLYVWDIVGPRWDPANWPGRSWLVSAIVDAVFGLVSVANVALGQAGVLEFALILRLVHPVSLFFRVLRSFDPRVVDG